MAQVGDISYQKKTTKSIDLNMPTETVIPYQKNLNQKSKNLEESKLSAWIINKHGNKRSESQNTEQKQQSMKDTLQIYEQKEKATDLFEEIKQLEDQYFQDTKEIIKESYEQHAIENKMGKKKCLEYFGLENIQNTHLGNMFFQCVKSAYPNKLAGPFLDFSKFMKTISMLSGGNKEGRLQFTFELFDRYQHNCLSKEDIQYFLETLFEILMQNEIQQFNYQDQKDLQYYKEFNELKMQLKKAHERDIEIALIKVIDEKLKEYARTKQFDTDELGIGYEDYKKWMMTEHKKCFEFNPLDIYQD